MKRYELDNGNYLLDDIGKYGSELVIISPDKEIKWTYTLPDMLKKFNIDGDAKVVYGNLRKTKKDRDLFEITPNGNFVFIEINGDRGCKGIEVLPEVGLEKKIESYYRRKTSNGGGIVVTYYVCKITDIQNIKIDIEDL